MANFEKRALNQINLTEGIISRLVKFFLGSEFRNVMKELERAKKDDPELEAGLASFKQNYEIIKRIQKRLEKELEQRNK